jgi:flagellar basal body-associated protein FliL
MSLHFIPIRPGVRNSILLMRPDSVSRHNELVFLKGKIIKELNQSLKANVIKDIVFTN